MPTYAYKCADCGHQFDIFQKFSEDALTVCPECNGAIRRVIQPVGVVFKGSGWYITDSRGSGSATASEKTEKPAAAESTAKTDAPAAEPAKAAEPSKPAEPAKAPEKKDAKAAASA